MFLKLRRSQAIAERMIRSSIELEGSKSISNRALLITAMASGTANIQAHLPENLSPSEDSRTLLRLLQSQDSILDAGAAGTTYRFLCAWLSIQEGTQKLTGSARMLQRPIRILVNALRELGAQISYLGEEGFPPLQISGNTLQGGRIHIAANVSSQYISALLMIGPALKEGLELELIGQVGSRPYIGMTLRIMEHFGISTSWKDNIIYVPHGSYHIKPFRVEGDWSAASYYYSIMALAAPGSRLSVSYLSRESTQGDAVLPRIYAQLGVDTQFSDRGIVLRRSQTDLQNHLEWDFSDCPDLAQTIVVTCAALGISARFSGLESLHIKETDRTAALAEELRPFGVDFREEVHGTWTLQGRLNKQHQALRPIKTYEDHRMAMAFAPLAMLLNELYIEDPEVVRKSYPGFWTDLERLGFLTEKVADPAQS